MRTHLHPIDRFVGPTLSRGMGLAVGLVLVGSLIGVLVANSATAAQAQNEDPAKTRTQEQVQERIRERIENDAALQERERQQLREHLAQCEQLGLDAEQVQALFSDEAPLKEQIRHQERVLTMAREGLPVDPLMEKLQEGRRKGAPEAVLDRVCAQLEEHVRTADRLMTQARQAGARGAAPGVEHRLTESLARNMWRGLEQGDFDRIMERAQQRLRDGSCSTLDLAAASATATDLHEVGVGRERAMRLAGDALQSRYQAGDIRRLSHMVMAAHAHGRPLDETLGTLDQGLQRRVRMQEMVQHMFQQGWMGPGDDHGGFGGHSPVDDVIGGPGDHHGGDMGGPGGGMGGDDGHGGSGGSGGDGGHGGSGGGGHGGGGN